MSFLKVECKMPSADLAFLCLYYYTCSCLSMCMCACVCVCVCVCVYDIVCLSHLEFITSSKHCVTVRVGSCFYGHAFSL